MVMAYVAEPQLFIADPNKSPFNVGTKLGLRDFSFEQVVELNRRYGSPMQRESDVERYHALLNGHPYLTGRGLHEMKNRNLSLPALEDSAARAEGLFGDHLRYVLTFLSYTPALADAARACVRGWPLPNDEVFYRLRSAGLVCGDSARDAAPRCKLYADFLRRHLT
jgi:hypothetical protein